MQPRILRTPDAARYLGLTASTLEKMRLTVSSSGSHTPTSLMLHFHTGRLRAQEGGSDRLPKSLNRFNGPGRGAWYAALEFETCVAEVSFHMERELSNISDFKATVDYAEMFASFIGDFVDVRYSNPKPAFLHPDPAEGYVEGNRFADAVRAAGHYGIIYSSLRHVDGTCLVALVPHAVQSVAQGRVLRLEWMGAPGPRVAELAGA